MPLSPRPLLFALALIAAAGPVLAQSRFETLLARFGGQDRYEGIASSNGRIEAQSVDVATKYAGRVTEIMAEEGEIVDAGTVLAQLDDREARAQLLAAQATVQAAIITAIRTPASSSRSASVDLPWSMCATMEKLRILELSI